MQLAEREAGYGCRQPTNATHQMVLIGDWPRGSLINFLENYKHWGQQVKFQSLQSVLDCY